MTAAIGLFVHLQLPQPWSPRPADEKPTPLAIYGAASSVGSFAVLLAQRAGIHPLLCVAGQSCDYVETLIDRSKGDVVIDYRGGDEAVVSGLQAALANIKQPLLHALDAVSEKGSYTNLFKVLAPGARLTTVLPTVDSSSVPDHIIIDGTMVGSAHGKDQDFAYVYFRYMARGLHEGWFKGRRHEVVPGGLDGVQTALQNLKEGKASGIKYLVRIADTK
jgi:NADPH:quinone reductase